MLNRKGILTFNVLLPNTMALWNSQVCEIKKKKLAREYFSNTFSAFLPPETRVQSQGACSGYPCYRVWCEPGNCREYRYSPLHKMTPDS